MRTILDAARESRQSEREISLEATGKHAAISSLKTGRIPSVERVRRLCEVLGLEFYVGPPRQVERIGVDAHAAALALRHFETLVTLMEVGGADPTVTGKAFVRLHDKYAEALDRLEAGGKTRGRAAAVIREKHPGEDFDLLVEIMSAGARPLRERGRFPFTDEEMGASGIHVSAWGPATKAQREQAMERLAAVERSNALADEGRPRAEADAIAGKEAGVSASAVGAWRARIQGIASPEARKEALLDRPRTGRPTSLDASMQKTLEDLAMRRGRHLTGEDARQALIEHHGKAPNVSTIRRWLKRRQDDYKDSTPDPGRSLPPGVEALGGLSQAEAPSVGDQTDLMDRVVDLAETAFRHSGIELGHEDYERLVAAIRELFNEMGGEEPEEGAARAADRVA